MNGGQGVEVSKTLFYIVKEKNKKDDINNIFVAVLSNMEVLAFVRISLKKTEKSEKIC